MLLPRLIIWCLAIFFSYGEKVFGEDGEFLYFAYGSNLLTKRIHVNNPTATFFAAAKLNNYRLDFNIYMESWNGAVATIVKDEGSYVWGALWTLDNKDMAHLDTQEGVDIGRYYAMNVSVVTYEGIVYEARTYKELEDPEKVPSFALPPERQPSETYKRVIIKGAYERSLPTDYIVYLSTFKSNGKHASPSVLESLGHSFNVTRLYYK